METVKDDDLLELSRKIPAEWEFVARYLTNDEEQISIIKQDYRNTREQIHQMLLFWKRNKGGDATYKVLTKALRQAGRNDLADDLSLSQGKHKGTPCGPTASLHPPGKTRGLKNTSPEERKKIFISFSFTVEKEVIELKDKIEEEIGKDSCWICTTEVGGGDRLDERITEGIHDADIILCMINEGYVNSGPCEEEVSLAHARKKHLIPILLENVKWPLEKSENVPSPMQLAFGACLYTKLYDEENKDEQFRRLMKKIKERLQLPDTSPPVPSTSTSIPTPTPVPHDQSQQKPSRGLTKEEAFRTVLVEIANTLKQRDVQRLVFQCPQIPQADKDSINDGVRLFEEMRRYGVLSVERLEELLEKSRLVEPLSLLQNFKKTL